MGDELALTDLLAGCAILDGEGLTSAFGHLSVTLTDGSVLVSGNAGPGLVQTRDDVLRVDLDGEVLDGDPALKPGELPIHLGLLRNGWVSVARFHGPATLAWGTLNRALPATLGVGMFCGGSVPCYDTARTVTTLVQGRELAACAEDGPAVILRGFGAATAGRTVREAVTRAWLLERNAAATLLGASSGTPQPYDAADAAPFVAADGPAAAQLARLWHYLTHKHPVREAV
jgi:ribulose-5-phosphate 4-epimerase/fuculose-1-phosphate aldolase